MTYIRNCKRSYVLIYILRKTQIALKLAQTMIVRFHVFWIRADNFTNFVNDFAKILEVLDPSTKQNEQAMDQTSLLQPTLTILESKYQDWILVLDNADDIEQFRPRGENNISTYVPRKGRILITTRDQRFQGEVAAAHDGQHVTPLTDEEANDLLLRSVPFHLNDTVTNSKEIASELLDELGNLPLAIAQAAANILELQLSLAQYVAAYRDKRQRMELLSSPARDFQTTDPRTSSQSVAVTWELSFEYLEKTQPLSAICLTYMGFWHWRDIPKVLVTRLPEFDGLSPLQFQRVINVLLYLSLVDEDCREGQISEYHLHPVVHERIFHRLNPEKRLRYLSPCVDALLTLFPLVSDDDDPDLAICRYLLPHAIHQLGSGEEISFWEPSFARLLQRLGAFLSIYGLTTFGVALASRALEVAFKVWNPEDPMILYIRRSKMIALYRNAQYENAEFEGHQALRELESLKPSLTTEGVHFQRIAILSSMEIATNNSGKHLETEQINRELLSPCTPLPNTPPFRTPKISENPDRYFNKIINY